MTANGLQIPQVGAINNFKTITMDERDLKAMNQKPNETPQLGVFGVMGSFSTVHYKCSCGWKGTIHELGKDFDSMECGGEEYHFCPKCKCYSGLSLNCP